MQFLEAVQCWRAHCEEAGQIFIRPSDRHSTCSRSGWLLANVNGFITMVSDEGEVLGGRLLEMGDSPSQDRRLMFVDAVCEQSGAESVCFQPDGSHITIGPIEGELIRYRIGAVAQKWLLGELGDSIPSGGPGTSISHAGS